jgi:hypothetical protein
MIFINEATIYAMSQMILKSRSWSSIEISRYNLTAASLVAGPVPPLRHKTAEKRPLVLVH